MPNRQSGLGVWLAAWWVDGHEYRNLVSVACESVHYLVWLCSLSPHLLFHAYTPTSLTPMAAQGAHGDLPHHLRVCEQNLREDRPSMLWSPQGPGERGLWKGRHGFLHYWYFNCEYPIQVFLVRKRTGADAGKICAMKVLRKVRKMLAIVAQCHCGCLSLAVGSSCSSYSSSSHVELTIISSSFWVYPNSLQLCIWFHPIAYLIDCRDSFLFP